MKYIQPSNGRVVRFFVGDEEVDDNIKNQMSALARMPFIFKNGISCMPDVHYCNGAAAVGAVIPTTKAIIPSTIGMDLYCGMSAVKTSLVANDLPDSLLSLRLMIESKIPSFSFNSVEDSLDNWDGITDLGVRLEKFMERDSRMFSKRNNIYTTMGTIGGKSSNHFVEVCLDENDQVWIMLHSGSRAFGGVIGKHYIEKAKQEMERYFINLPDKELSYLVHGTQVFDDYIEGSLLAEEFAFQNRKVMMRHVIESLATIVKPFELLDEAIDCHHNYVTMENHFNTNMYITRKGAINAKKGKMGIIPGSMGAKSYIVRGKGEESSYTSCSHGAGRVMSRGKARHNFSVDDLVQQTYGVECKKDESVIDEIPSAYKDLDVVMANQKDLVDIVHTLKAVVCVKG